ncbi:MAG: TonB-dependent receptor [Pseudomonadota bacterium]
MLNRYCVLAIAVSLATPAFGQESVPPGEEAPPPETIVVTGFGLSASPSLPAYDSVVVDRDRLLATSSGRLEDALSAVAGVQQFRRSDSRSSNPSAQGLTLRALGGNATSRTLVLLDGVPMADPFFGYIPLSAIAPETLASARVTRGGGAGAFGAGAVAGTIDLASAGPDDLGLLRASALVDDRGETELSASLAPRLGEGFAVVSGRWDRGRGFWTTPESQRDPLSVRARYDSWSVGLRAVARLSDQIEVQGRLAAFDDQRTLRFAGADSRSQGQDASIRVVGHGAWQFEALGYVQAREFASIVVSSNPAAAFRKTLDQFATPSTGLGGKLELRPPVGGGHLLRLGADLRIADGSEAEAAYSTATGLVTARRRMGGRNTDLGLYLEDDWSFGPLVLTGGVRADRWSIMRGFFREAAPDSTVTTDNAYPGRSGWDVTLRGGGVVQATRSLAVRASAYSGVRQPTLNELYRSFTVFPVVTRANENLRNEKLEGYEAGIDFSPARWATFTVTAFDNRIRHAIANVTIGTNLRQRQNVGAVRSRGVELGAGLRLGTLSLDASYAYTDAKMQAGGISADLDGKRPAQTPRHAASGTLAWAPRDGWRLATTVRHIGAQFEDDLQTNILPPATTVDAYAEVPLGSGFAVVLRGENLLDEEVVTRKQGPSIDLGAPRTVWFGVKARLP